MKKLTLFLPICGLFTILTFGNALAAWQEIGQNEQSTISIDIATLQIKGDKAQIVSMLDFKKPGEDPKTKEKVNAIIGLNEFDCTNAKYRPIEFKVFSGNLGQGKVIVDQKTPDSAFEAIPNGSWAAGVYSIACRRK